MTTEDTIDPNFFFDTAPPRMKTEKIEKAFKDIRSDEADGHTDFDFGIDDFSWM
ncbi:MAG: hypothetical protein AAGF81_10755 [Pseudomonadota bacterium]